MSRRGALVCAALAAAACGRSATRIPPRGGGDPAAGSVRAAGQLPHPSFLAAVPDDAPYAFAYLWPISASVAERDYLARLARLVPLREDLARLARSSPDAYAQLDAILRLELALLDETGGAATVQALAAIGLAPTTRGVFYGVGTARVMRIELSDPRRFAAALERMAARLHLAWQSHDGHRYVELSDPQWTWVVAVRRDVLVLAALPLGDRSALSLALAARAPDRPLAAERLAQVARVLGMGSSDRPALGFVAPRRLLESAGAPLPAACRDDLAVAADQVPLISLGLPTPADEAANLRFEAVIETTGEVATALGTLRGAVPGIEPLSADQVVSISLAVDVPTLARLLDQLLARVGASSSSCPMIGSVRTAAAGIRAGLAKVASSPLARLRGASGVLATSGNLLSPGVIAFLGSDQPRELLAALAGALGAPVPAAVLGGPPVALVTPQPSVALGDIHVALREGAVGVAIGDTVAELAEMMGVEPEPDPPLVQVRLRPAWLQQIGRLIGDGPAAATAGPDPELARKMSERDELLGEFEVVELTVRALPRGVAIRLTGQRRETAPVAAPAPPLP